MGVSRNGVLKSLWTPGVPLMKHESVEDNIFLHSVSPPSPPAFCFFSSTKHSTTTSLVARRSAEGPVGRWKFLNPTIML